MHLSEVCSAVIYVLHDTLQWTHSLLNIFFQCRNVNCDMTRCGRSTYIKMHISWFITGYIVSNSLETILHKMMICESWCMLTSHTWWALCRSSFYHLPLSTGIRHQMVYTCTPLKIKISMFWVTPSIDRDQRFHVFRNLVIFRTIFDEKSPILWCAMLKYSRVLRNLAVDLIVGWIMLQVMTYWNVQIFAFGGWFLRHL